MCFFIPSTIKESYKIQELGHDKRFFFHLQTKNEYWFIFIVIRYLRDFFSLPFFLRPREMCSRRNIVPSEPVVNQFCQI